ncbi:hypothetical protein GGF32_002415 [Allomyces javanicus]|nr:hypothetical protein GGF32_002415 [Allomyces javanicus]
MQALELVNKMEKHGTKPEESMWSLLLMAVSNLKKQSKAIRRVQGVWASALSSSRGEPSSAVYGVYLQCLVQLGEFDSALTRPFVDEIAFTTLLDEAWNTTPARRAPLVKAYNECWKQLLAGKIALDAHLLSAMCRVAQLFDDPSDAAAPLHLWAKLQGREADEIALPPLPHTLKDLSTVDKALAADSSPTASAVDVQLDLLASPSDLGPERADSLTDAPLITEQVFRAIAIATDVNKIGSLAVSILFSALSQCNRLSTLLAAPTSTPDTHALATILSTVADPDQIEPLAHMHVADVLRTLPDHQMLASNLRTVLHFSQTTADVFPATAMERGTWCTSPAYLALRALELDRGTVEAAVIRTFDTSAGMTVQNWAATTCTIKQVSEFAHETASRGDGKSVSGDPILDALPQRIWEVCAMGKRTEKQIARMIALDELRARGCGKERRRSPPPPTSLPSASSMANFLAVTQFQHPHLLHNAVTHLVDLGRIDDALATIVASPQAARVAAVWHPILQQYAIEGAAMRAVELVRDMEWHGVEPDDYTWSLVFMALSKSRSWSKAVGHAHGVWTGVLRSAQGGPRGASPTVYGAYLQCLVQLSEWASAVDLVLRDLAAGQSFVTEIAFTALLEEARIMTPARRETLAKAYDECWKQILAGKVAVDAHLLSAMCRTAKLLADPRDAAAPLHLWAKLQGGKANEIVLPLLPDVLKHLSTVELEIKMTFPLPEATTNWLMLLAFQVDKMLAAEPSRAAQSGALDAQLDLFATPSDPAPGRADSPMDTPLVTEQVFRVVTTGTIAKKLSPFGTSILLSALSQCHRPKTLLIAYFHARHGKSLKKLAELLDDSRAPLPAAVLRKIAAHSLSMDDYSAVMQSLTTILPTVADRDGIEPLVHTLVADVLKRLTGPLTMRISNLRTILHFAQAANDVFPATATMDLATWRASPEHLVLCVLDLDRDTVEEAVRRLFDPAKRAGMTSKNWMTTTRAITQILERAWGTAPSTRGKGAHDDRFLDTLPLRDARKRPFAKRGVKDAPVERKGPRPTPAEHRTQLRKSFGSSHWRDRLPSASSAAQATHAAVDLRPSLSSKPAKDFKVPRFQDSYLLREHVARRVAQGRPDEALAAIHNSPHAAGEAAVWHPVLHEYATEGAAKRARALVVDMKKRGAKPDDHTWSLVFLAVSNSTSPNKANEARTLWEAVHRTNGDDSPSRVSPFVYNTFVQCMVRAEQWELAADLVLQDVAAGKKYVDGVAFTTLLDEAKNPANVPREPLVKVYNECWKQLLAGTITVDGHLISVLCIVAKLFDNPRDAAAPLHLWAKLQGGKAREIDFPPLPDALKSLPTTRFETRTLFPLSEPAVNWLVILAFQVDKLIVDAATAAVRAAAAEAAAAHAATKTDQSKFNTRGIQIDLFGASSNEEPTPAPAPAPAATTPAPATTTSETPLIIEQLFPVLHRSAANKKPSQLAISVLFSAWAQLRRPTTLLTAYFHVWHDVPLKQIVDLISARPPPSSLLRMLPALPLSMDGYNVTMHATATTLPRLDNAEPFELLVRTLSADVSAQIDGPLRAAHLRAILRLADAAATAFPATPARRDVWLTTPAGVALRAFKLDEENVGKAVKRALGTTPARGNADKGRLALLNAMTRVLDYAQRTAPRDFHKDAEIKKVVDAISKRIEEAAEMRKWVEEQLAIAAEAEAEGGGDAVSVAADGRGGSPRSGPIRDGRSQRGGRKG